MVVRFLVRRSPTEAVEVEVEDGAASRLSQRSLTLRDKMEDAQPARLILLECENARENDFDLDAVRYLLENLGLASAQVTGRLGVRNLSRQCNALWHYKCVPVTFRILWDQLARPWAPLHTADDLQRFLYRWRVPQPPLQAEAMLYYANIAWVLGEKDPFREAILSVTWDSVVDGFPTAVRELRDLKVKRCRYMKSVYEVMVDHVRLLKDSRVTWDVGNKIQRKILDSDRLNVNLINNWEVSRDKLSRFSVYGFVHQVDLVLLNDTSGHPVPPPPSSTAPAPHADTDATSVSPKAPTVIRFWKVAGKATELISSALGNRYTEEVRKLLTKLDDRIRADQELFAEELFEQRDRLLKTWRDELLQERHPEHGMANGAAVGI